MIRAAASPARPVSLHPIWLPALATGALLLTLWVLAASPLIWLRGLAILTLGWWLPGLLLALLWRLPEVEMPPFLLIAFGLGAGWMLLGALLAHYILGPLTLVQLSAVYAIPAFALILALLVRPPPFPAPVARTVWLWGLVLLVLAVALRLPGLGYHEFHADEVVLLRQAGRAVEGQDDALAEHTKGPGELALALALYRGVGTVDEGLARLPFALLSVGSVLATAWLGRRMLGPPPGFWAGVLLALNGFALGLSRIAQYQAAILLLSALAVLAAWEFSRNRHWRWLALAAAFSAFAMVLHYEFGLLAPALVLLVWLGVRRSPARRPLWITISVAAVAGGALLAAAYVPALLAPYFSTTQGYLTNRMGEVGTFNVPFFVEMGTFYNSTYFFVGLVILAALGTFMGWRRGPQTRLAVIVLTLWWLPFFILYIFVVRFPGTHFYLLMESWSLLAALALAAILAAARARPPLLRWGVIGLVAAWLLVSSGYLYLLFFRQNPEYLVNLPNSRVPFYWAPYPTPEKPRFGFPIHEGWETLGVLGQWGYLQGTYAGNDGAWSLRRWYLTPFSKRHFDEQPDYIFVAKHLQEADPEFDDDILDAYQRIGEVRVRGEPRIEIWSRTGLPVPYVTFDAEHFAAPFLRDVAALEPAADPPALVREVNLGDTVQLESAHLTTQQVNAGGVLDLLLVWRALQSLGVDYKVFVHVAGPDGVPVAQWDGLPGLNTVRTSQWTVGEPFRDHVLLPIPAATPPGDYTLLAGLYDPATGLRVGDQAIPLTTIQVE